MNMFINLTFRQQTSKTNFKMLNALIYFFKLNLYIEYLYVSYARETNQAKCSKVWNVLIFKSLNVYWTMLLNSVHIIQAIEK